MGEIKEQTIRVDNEESWTFLISLKTYDTKSHKAVPWNIVNMFVVMHILDINNNLLLSASQDTSDTVMANAISGQAVMSFPLTATTGMAAGSYQYKAWVADFPYLTSATYSKKVRQGSFEVD